MFVDDRINYRIGTAHHQDGVQFAVHDRIVKWGVGVLCASEIVRRVHSNFVQTRYLWIPERVAKNELKIVAIGTKLSDLCSKPANKGTCEKHMKSFLNQISDIR